MWVHHIAVPEEPQRKKLEGFSAAEARCCQFTPVPHWLPQELSEDKGDPRGWVFAPFIAMPDIKSKLTEPSEWPDLT